MYRFEMLQLSYSKMNYMFVLQQLQRYHEYHSKTVIGQLRLLHVILTFLVEIE